MTSERWQQIELLYHAALERAPGERTAFLNEACAGDDELRGEIESLLASHDQAPSFIEAPPEDVAAGMLAEQQSHLLVGRTLGRYRVQSQIGAGGMGEVYRARDVRLDRDVAIKILPEHLAQDPEALRRFEREAKAVAALSHPNIMAIYDFGTEGDVSYAVMELLEGETVRERLKHAPINWPNAVDIALALAEGLAAAHAKGIIHRDLKPENIFLTTQGQIKILDFGIARMKKAVVPSADTLTATEMTLPGRVMGTIGYLSPEQARGEQADAPSDLFSLGCVLYEMICGERPFDRQSVAETIAAILMTDPPALGRRAGPIPAGLERVVGKALRKDRDRRYQTAADLLADLKRLTPSFQDKTLPINLTPKPFRWQTAAAVGALVLVLAVAAVFRLNRQRPTQTGPNNVAANNITVSNATPIEVLRYSLEVESAGQWKRTSRAEALAARQQFRFQFTPRTDGYLYLIATGRQNIPTTFLTAQPTRTAGVASNRLAAGIEFIFPGAGNGIEIGGIGSLNVFTIIFSPIPLQRPAFLTTRAERQLTAAEQGELNVFRQQYSNPTPGFQDDAASQKTLVTLPANRDQTAPLVFDVPLKRQ
jgi:serine/threonine protein kinase